MRARASSGAGETIYIVDDHAEARDSLALLLGSAGFNTRAFATAGAFLAAAPAAVTGCALFDVRLPDMDGSCSRSCARSAPGFRSSSSPPMPTCRSPSRR